MIQPAAGTTVAMTGSRLLPSTTLLGNPCDKAAMITASCGSAWKRDPVSGVIGVEKGPLILVF